MGQTGQRLVMRHPRFWLVWNEGGHAPTVKHDSYSSARFEAERLALCHGGTFHVLVVEASCVKHEVDWREYDDPEPF